MGVENLRPAEEYVLSCCQMGEEYDICTAMEKIFGFLEGQGFVQRDGEDFLATGKPPTEDLRQYEKKIILQMIRDKDRPPDGEAIICILEEFSFQDLF